MGGNVLSIIDTKSFKRVGEVTGLPGHSNEGMVIDHEGKKLYGVTSRAQMRLESFDLNTRQLIARWPLPECTCSSCHSPGRT